MDMKVIIMMGCVLCTTSGLCFMELRRIRKKIGREVAGVKSYSKKIRRAAPAHPFCVRCDSIPDRIVLLKTAVSISSLQFKRGT